MLIWHGGIAKPSNFEYLSTFSPLLQKFLTSLSNIHLLSYIIPYLKENPTKQVLSYVLQVISKISFMDSGHLQLGGKTEQFLRTNPGKRRATNPLEDATSYTDNKKNTPIHVSQSIIDL